MVKLHISLLAVTLATGSAVACSNEFQRRSESDPNIQVRQLAVPNLHLRFGYACARHDNLQSRGFVDEEDLFVRDDAFDDVEARAFSTKSASGLFSFGKKLFENRHAKAGVKHLGDIYKHGRRISEHKNTKHALKAFDTASDVYDGVQTLNSRGLEDNEDLFERDLDAFDDLEAREPGEGSFKALGDAWKFGKMLSEHKNTKHLMTAVDVGTQVYGAVQMVKSRGLEDDEDIFVRDLDAFDDLEAREPAGGGLKALSDAWKFGRKLSEHKNTKHLMTAVDVGSQVYGAVQMVNPRGLEDDEDIFGRDLDTEELFGREYDLFDERDTFDDLD